MQSIRAPNSITFKGEGSRRHNASSEEESRKETGKESQEVNGPKECPYKSPLAAETFLFLAPVSSFRQSY